uniref:Uncharacterized protein n=1 Tax=Setaria italica TaxID=4555 RepID=K3Y0P9_SETIT
MKFECFLGDLSIFLSTHNSVHVDNILGPTAAASCRRSEFTLEGVAASSLIISDVLHVTVRSSLM